MKSFSQFLNEASSGASDDKPIVPMSDVKDYSGLNVSHQGLHKGMTVVRSAHDKDAETIYTIHTHQNPKNKYVDPRQSADATITHYHYSKNKKPSYITDTQHNNCISKGRYVVTEPSRSILGTGVEHYHKSAGSALKHAKEIATRTRAAKMSDAYGAAETYSHKNFSQLSHRG